MPTTSEAIKCSQCAGYGFDLKANEICKRCNGSAVEPGSAKVPPTADAIGRTIQAAIDQIVRGGPDYADAKCLRADPAVAKKDAPVEHVYVAMIHFEGETWPTVIGTHKREATAVAALAQYCRANWDLDEEIPDGATNRGAVELFFKDSDREWYIDRQEVKP